MVFDDKYCMDTFGVSKSEYIEAQETLMQLLEEWDNKDGKDRKEYDDLYVLSGQSIW